MKIIQKRHFVLELILLLVLFLTVVSMAYNVCYESKLGYIELPTLFTISEMYDY